MITPETEQQAAKEAFDRVFHGMPPKAEREKMSPENLVLELAKHQSGSPAYTLLSHELDRRIAKDQSIATWRAAIAGGLFALASATLGAWLTAQPSKECVSQWHIEHERPQAKLQVPPSAVQLPAQPVIQPQPKSAGAHGKQRP